MGPRVNLLKNYQKTKNMAKKIKSRAHIPTVLKFAKANNITPYWCERDGIFANPAGVCPFCGTKGTPYKEGGKKRERLILS